MNASDLAILSDVTTRTSAIVRRLQLFLTIGLDLDAGMLVDTLHRLEAQVSHLAEDIQQREVVSWGRREHPPSRLPPRHLAPTTSSDLPHGIHVQRFDIAGNRPSETRSRRPLSGAWQMRGRACR